MTTAENRQLLCTFSKKVQYKRDIDKILEFYKVYNNKIFVFCNEKNEEDVFITYNILGYDRDYPKFPNTISIHRKKNTNTLYTLNAMNRIIEDENSGILDKQFQVDWDLYKNSLIITGEISVKIIPIKILDILS